MAGINMETLSVSCPVCGALSEWIGVTPEPDERDTYFDIHWCAHCKREFEDTAHPMTYDYDEEFFVEAQTPQMTHAQMEAAGQLRLFDEESLWQTN